MLRDHTAMPNPDDVQPVTLKYLICCTIALDINLWLICLLFYSIQEQGGWAHIGGMIYFFCSIMVGAFVFANLVVAVVVTNLVSEQYVVS